MPLERNYLREQLREVPAFRALIRAIECRLFQELEPIPSPTLDLGCGDGQFAQSTFATPPAAGIDIDSSMVHEAKARGAYRFVAAASATALPFRDASFRSVLANCSIEHVPDAESVISEVSRVLSPGGLFVLSVPSQAFGGMLMGTRIFSSIRLKGLSRAYADWFNRKAAHFHLDSPEEWARRLEKHGLPIQHWQYYLSAEAVRCFDLAHYLSVPSLLSRKITGKWVLFPNLFTRKLFEKWFWKYTAEDLPQGAEGGCIFIVSRKED